MNTPKTRCCLFVLLILFVLILGTGGQALAEQSLSEWTVEIGQQLVAEGWESYRSPVNPAVIGYAIHFVELDRGLVKKLNLGLELDTGKSGNGMWGVSVDDTTLAFLLDSPFLFAPSLTGFTKEYDRARAADSWLLTTTDKPLQVKLSNKKIGDASGGRQVEGLEILLRPKRLDREGKRIETDFSLSYESSEGSLAQTETTVWVGANFDKPLAVVAREVKIGGRYEQRFFAMYLAGTTIPDDLIPQGLPLMPVGTIRGMQGLMAEPEARRSTELGLGASYGEDRWGWEIDASVPIKDLHRFYGQIRFVDDLAYTLGAEGGITDGLSMVGEFSNEFADRAMVLRMGVMDEVRLNANAKVAVAILPIQITLNSGNHTTRPHWRMAAIYDPSTSWNMWYQLQWLEPYLEQTVGVSLRKDQPLGIQMSWTWDRHKGNRFQAGLSWRF